MLGSFQRNAIDKLYQVLENSVMEFLRKMSRRKKINTAESFISLNFYKRSFNTFVMVNLFFV